MLRPDLSREELTDIQGQLYVYKTIDFLPKEVEKQLESLLTQEGVKREIEEASRAGTRI